MEALFVGHAYIDVTMLADALPQGDDKTVAKDYAISFGGNAVTPPPSPARNWVATSTSSPPRRRTGSATCFPTWPRPKGCMCIHAR